MVAPGVRLGPYEILAPLGAGGMGEVWRARDKRLDREVAIKVLPTELAERPEAMARFEREARAAAALTHPNILSVFEFGVHERTAYAVMELLEGETVRARLAAGPLPMRRAVEYGLQIVQGLAAAHEKGIVHRDIKPENLFLTGDGRVKILDFGLARMDVTSATRGDDSRSPTLERQTEPGTVMGTVGYMSPEQVRGIAADARSDIFSFGAVLYEMVTGRRPFAGESAVETMNAVLKEDPRAPSQCREGLTPELDRVVLHCLEKRPDERFQSARDLAFDLAGVAGSTTRGEPQRAPVHGTAIHWPVIGATLVVLGLLSAFAAGRRLGVAPERASQRPPSFVQLTDIPGVEGEPKLAPDGKSFVYVGDAEGNLDIYLQRVGGGKEINLTQDSLADDWQPALSSDGERIAFRSERGPGGIFVMGATGESVKRLTDFGYHPSWSPDGKSIVVSSAGYLYPIDRVGTGQLLVIDVATGAKRSITQGQDAVQPSWSPHGARIAFWGLRGSTSQRDLWTVSADGSASPAAVTNDPALDWNPVWSPDGAYLYFSSMRGGTMNVWRISIDEASGRIRSEPEPLTTPSSWSGSISFSLDGRRLAYATLEWRSTLLRAAFDPAKETLAGAPVRVLRSTLTIRDHALSPDGDWVAFTTAGFREDLFVARMVGAGYRRLTDDRFSERFPSWSPDGQRIAFQSDRDGAHEIWTIRPDGSGLTQLTRTGLGLSDPEWSPDGSRLSASGTNNPEGLVLSLTVIPLESIPPPLARVGEGLFFNPYSWSRDGLSLLGVTVNANGVAQGLATYSTATKRYRDLIPNPSANWLYPVWLSDGRRLLFRDHNGIALLDSQTGRSRQLLSVSGYYSVKSLGITRDDRWITYTETATEGDVWLASLD